MKPVVLVDGSSYLFRAYHALPPLTNKAGMPTGAIYGVINMLRKLIKDESPEKVLVVFDGKGKTFRHEMYTEYKANRPAMPEELACQIAPLHKVIQAMGLPLVIADGVEADDLIGTYAVQAVSKGVPVLISTGDKDFAQLVNDKITLVNTMTGKVMDPAGVVEKFNVKPEQIIDYLALIGDTVDNVPGVPKVGPKTAAKWLAEYGSLDNIIANQDSIKGKIGENLRSAVDSLPLSKELVTIKTDCDVPLSFDELVPGVADEDALRAQFSELEFKTWLNELGNKTVKTSYTIINTLAEFKKWQDKIEKADRFGFDLETTSLSYMHAKIVGVALALKDEAAYIPVGHTSGKMLDKAVVLDWLGTLPGAAMLGHNLKYDKHVLLNEGITNSEIAGDSMLASYVYRASQNRHDLDTVAQAYLGRATISYEQVTSSGKAQIPFADVEIEKAAEYAAEDAQIAFDLCAVLEEKLEEGRLKEVYDNIELPLVDVLVHMEHSGVKIDSKLLGKQSVELNKKCQQIEKEVFDEVGEEFNLSSPKQLQEILFDKLGLPVIERTAKGAASTSESALNSLRAEHPIVDKILTHRSLIKLLGTYTEKLPTLVNESTGRVHTSYHQAVTATGRLSSSDPNLQNIPIRTNEGRAIRKAFIAEKGCKLISADYSQVELRIMAHLSGDKSLLKAFAEDKDIHRHTASEIFAVDIDKVTDEQRRHAKAINFGLIYGMSAFGLSRQLNIGRAEATEYMDIYFKRYPGVKKYMESTKERGAKDGFVETLFGRKIVLNDLLSKNPNARTAAERIAINAPMQGTAADLIKKAMIAVYRDIVCAGLGKLVMQVHDELVLEVADKNVDKVSQMLVAAMESAGKLKVPLLVECKSGDNWEAAH